MPFAKPRVGAKAVSAVLGVTKGYRDWFFAVSEGRGKPAVAFVTAQVFNIPWALLIVWLLWSGALFVPPIK